ncbi:MAG: oligoendopeptidase F [Bacilli bacterium]
MIKEKKRSEIALESKWDLSTIYKGEKDVNDDIKKAQLLLDDIKKYTNKIMDSSSNLLELIKKDLELDELFSKIYVYACMKLDEDMTNSFYQSLKGKIDNLKTLINSSTSFIVPELLKSDYNLVLQYIEENKALEPFKKYLEEIFRYKDHTLSSKEERIISSFSNLFKVGNSISSLICNSDLKLGTIKDEIELTNSNFSLYISSKDREVRKEAFDTMYKAYAGFKNTLAKTLASEVESNVTLANLKGYKNALECALFADNIDETIYNNLIKTVNDNLNVLFKYYDLKKEVLGLDEMHLYDIYVDLIKTTDKTYSFLEGKNLIKQALSVLGEDYLKNIDKAFNENWIDIYPNEGKKSGAYSWGSYGTNPFVLLNYQGKLNDVSTLAHELGHSMHSHYSHKFNDYQYASYSIFVAEVASTVNELLLDYYLLANSQSSEEKLTILNNLMELYKGTIFRQTMFAEFEKEIYNKSSEGEVLTSEFLSNLYYDLNKKYFGSSVIVDENIKYEWERIPHFYMFFYVYQYATGLSAASHIVEGILNHKENAVSDYLAFLKTGGSDYPVNELKIAGVDITNKEVIESAIKMFDDVIEQFKQLYN